MSVVLVCLASAKGSPGVTTLGVAMVRQWPGGRCLLAECDPAGGDVLPGYRQGAGEAGRDLAGLAAAARRGDLAQLLPGYLLEWERGRYLLPGVPDPGRAAWLGTVWEPLAEALGALEIGGEPVDVVADCGRLGSVNSPTALLRRADLVAVVTRSNLPAVHTTRKRLAVLREELAGSGTEPGGLVAVVVGEGQPYTCGEISEHLTQGMNGGGEVPVAATVPDDAAGAAVFSYGAPPPRRFATSVFLRATAAAAQVLHERARARRTAGSSLEVRHGRG